MARAAGSSSEDRQRQVSGLYRDFGPVVYRRCLRLLRDRAAAQDATQEVFLKLLGNLEKLQDRETVLPWIYRVATNHCLNLRRDVLRRGEEAAEEDERALPPSAQGRSTDAVLDWNLARSLLVRFDSETQAVAVGVFVDGMNHDEVAEALGISRRTVSRRLERFVESARRFIGHDGEHLPSRPAAANDREAGSDALARG